MLHSEPMLRGGCGWIRTTNLAFMRRMLFRLSYTAVEFWKPAEELNLVPFRPTLAGSV